MKIPKIKTASAIGSEKMIYLRLKNKDRQAFAKAYDLYIDQVYRFIYFKVGDKDEAEDLTSAVFLKIWDYIQEGNAVEYKTLKSLIYKVARNTVIDYYRKNSRRSNIGVDSADGLEIRDEKNDLAKKMEIKSEYENIEKKLLKLKDEYREVIVLRFIEELSISEIAKIINKPKGGVRVLVFRALEALKKMENQI